MQYCTSIFWQTPELCRSYCRSHQYHLNKLGIMGEHITQGLPLTTWKYSSVTVWFKSSLENWVYQWAWIWLTDAFTELLAFAFVLRAMGSYNMGNCTYTTDILKPKEEWALKWLSSCFGFNLQKEENQIHLTPWPTEVSTRHSNVMTLI